jgi:hypothetical protein
MSNRQFWAGAHTAAYCHGGDMSELPAICIVPTRYTGAYEGGLFAAMSRDDLDSSAFGQDCEASAWWDHNKSRVGIGNTPNDALADWYAKLGAGVIA